jgi:hypothetical protein
MPNKRIKGAKLYGWLTDAVQLDRLGEARQLALLPLLPP